MVILVLRILTVTLLLVVAESAQCDDSVSRVGELGFPENWLIEGVESFEPERVRRSLSLDFDVVLAAHPQAPLSQFAGVLRQRLLEGYRSVGYINAEAKVEVDEKQSQVRINVVEGTQRRCGEVRVVGVVGELAERLKRSITTKQLPESAVTPVIGDDGVAFDWLDQDGDTVELEDAAWEEGKPLPFHQARRDSIMRRIARTLSDHGYFQAKFTHEVVPSHSTAELLINISDLGTVAVLREIEIVGNERNTDAEITDYLKLRLGSHFANGEQQQALLMLRESARFIEQQVNAEPLTSGGIKLKITLKELSVAPRLSEPLSREDRALLKLRSWETTGEGRLLDRVIHLKTDSLTFVCVISPQAGLIVTLRIPNITDSSRQLAHVFLASNQEMACCNLRERRRFVLPLTKLGLVFETGLGIRSDEGGDRFKVTFGSHFSSVSDETSQPSIDIKTIHEPVYYLALSRLQNAASSWHGDELTVASDWGTLTVDAVTGRLISRTFVAAQYGSTVIEYRAGAFEEAVAELKRSTIGYRNEYDANRPLSSAIRYGWSLFEVLTALEVDIDGLQELSSPVGLAAMNKLLDHGLLDSLDRSFAGHERAKDNDDFSIPPSQPLAFTVDSIGRVAAAFADTIFPRGSWPSVVWRETALMLAQHPEYTMLELKQVMNDDSFGAIGHWLTAEMLKKRSPSLAALIARRGVKRLRLAAFDDEIELLIGQWSAKLDSPVRAICSLSDNEVAAIGRFAFNDTEELVQVVKVLRQNSQGDTEDIVMAALCQLWAIEWQELVSSRLRTLSMERLPPVARKPTD